MSPDRTYAAAEQRDAADEAGASDGASPLISVLDGLREYSHRARV